MNRITATAFVVFSAWAAPASALDFHNDDVSIGGYLCVGPECTSGEAYVNGEVLSLEGDLLRVRFADTSSGSFPTSDWRIDINDAANGGANYFAIGDVNWGTQPFKIDNNAPHHALTIQSSGEVGIGTFLPLTELHVVGSYPELTFEDTTNTRRWLVHAANNFYVRDISNDNIPLHIAGNAPDYSLSIKGSTGNVGLGTFSPQGKLHTAGSGTQLAYFESTNGGAVQMRFRTNSQNRRFLALDNANNVKTQMQFRDNEILFMGQTANDEWLKVSAGGIITAGPTCSPNPCDATFDQEAFQVPPIAERAAQMWEQKHLPAVGPTQPGQPFNVTEKTAGMLHELEVAHIYIGQLHQRLEQQEERMARMERLLLDLSSE